MAKSNLSSGFAGFLVGVVTGLAIAAGAALFISKSPIPFVEKVQKVTADVDPAEKLKGSVDPNRRLNEQMSAPANASSNEIKTIDNYSKKLATSQATPSRYWLQTGSFRSEAEAEQQKAVLAMNAFSATVIRSNDRWLVQVGPFTVSEDAEDVLEQLNQANIHSTLVKHR